MYKMKDELFVLAFWYILYLYIYTYVVGTVFSFCKIVKFLFFDIIEGQSKIVIYMYF